jgi:hypothetical protein
MKAESIDAKEWAEEFMRVINDGNKLDEEMVRLWFSRAIENAFDAGFDRGKQIVWR